MIRPLATKLEKEAVYNNNFCLSRQYSGDGELVKEDFSKNIGHGLAATKKNSSTIASLKVRLEKYNQIKPGQDKKISKVSQSIADDLQALGYHI
jgi:hypothetical protein